MSTLDIFKKWTLTILTLGVTPTLAVIWILALTLAVILTHKVSKKWSLGISNSGSLLHPRI